MPSRKVRPSERRRCPRACTNCKRRKERCDGLRPCRRCTERSVSNDCTFHHVPQIASTLQSPEPEPHHSLSHGPRGAPRHHDHDELLCFHRVSRVVKDDRGSLLFIGDASNLCFLQDIRRIVVKHFGHCSFVGDPLRRCMVEAHPDAAHSLADASNRSAPPALTEQEVDNFLTWFERTTDCIVPLFDRADLRRDVLKWHQNPADCSNIQHAIFHLVVAIGAQAGPGDQDDLAERHFNFGRYITLTTLMDEPSIATIQSHTLITTYLLAGSRRNAAFMYLGIAVRAAYALGIHRRDVSLLYDPAECAARERLWRGLRIMDLFLSASLGRPPATTETRDTTSAEDYSASNDLCWIFEEILTSIYSKRVITADCLARLSQLHRDWSLRFARGLYTDGIRPGGPFYAEPGEIPNIGLLHLKEAYYWTINLLSRPFLVQYVNALLDQRNSSFSHASFAPDLDGHLIVVQACVDSAFRTADLLYPLVSSTLVPKRLPFAVNSAFIAVLVLSTALFADLEDSSVLSRGIQKCRAVLHKFSRHDAVTQRYLVITDYMQEVCEAAIQARRQEKMDSIGRSIRQVFGSIHGPESLGDKSPHASDPASGECENQTQPQDMAVQAQNTPTSASHPLSTNIAEGTELSTAADFENVDLSMQTYSLTQPLSPFTAAVSTPGPLDQDPGLSFPTTLHLGLCSDAMIFPTVNMSVMDFGISGDWEKGFTP